MKCSKLLLLVLSLFCFSCSVSKHIPENEQLIRTSNITLINPGKISKARRLKPELINAIRPIPQYGLGKFNLWIYYKTDSPKEKGFRNWLKRKFGRKPIYFQDKTINRNKLLLERKMENQGYFGAEVTVDTSASKEMFKVEYQVKSKGQYKIRKIHYPADTIPLHQYVRPGRKEKDLLPQSYYSKEKIDNERERIYTVFGQNGLLDFPKEAIQIFVDTTVGDKQVDIFFTLRQVDSSATQPYYLGETYIYPDYVLETSDKVIGKDTILKKNLTLIQNNQVLRPKVLERILTQKKGNINNRRDQSNSLSRLLDLGVFKFVNADYEKRISGDSLLLDRKFFLTPGLTQDIIGEFGVNNRTGNFFGTSASATYVHRNLISGAERLDITLRGGVETQLVQSVSLINTLDFLAEVKLTLPRFLVPFRLARTFNTNSPVTSLKIGNNLQQRNEFYTVNAFSVDIGYDWKENIKITHSLTPIRLYWVNLLEKTDAFEVILNENPRLKTSFEDIFIAGLEYSYVVNTQTEQPLIPYLFARVKFSSSGNLVSLLSSGNNTNNTNEIFGIPYAQFVKISPEIRYFLPQKSGLFAGRLFFGIGLPYGNSDELPYLEQYFVGGANSIRAFVLRRLGPGNFFNNTSETNDDFLDQTGDLKMEFNLEYRSNIISFLKGAIFIDAGNVWLLKSVERPEGVFEFNSFYKQIAVGTGLGLRLDFGYFVARLDAAFAIREPVNNDEFKWTISDVRLFDKNWRNDNLVWNLAIGYPF